MAKRQSMILVDTLPSPQTRLGLFETAQKLFMWDGYKQIGIDHFAKPTDGLAIAANTKKLRRNFQGYTDDTCAVLLGLGASAISRFPQGYAQNASGTADYQQAVRAGQLATGRGHVFHGQDRLRARMIEMLMCDNQIDLAEIARDFAPDLPVATQACAQAAAQFGDLIIWQDDRFLVKPTGRPLLRMIARVFDEYDMSSNSHSSAI
jgi:oxygen-independent coproporphyrinogen-3 oxidase